MVCESKPILTPQLRRKLVQRLTQSIRSFHKLGQSVYVESRSKYGQEGNYTYIDNGSKILGVAHLDCVLYRKPRWEKKGQRIVCPQLDDRLGVWILLDLLPSLGVQTDILLTENEEIGQSTAWAFDTGNRDYNWMYQFDRRGKDCVLYDYDSPENRSRLEKSRFTVGQGSFSDICELDHLGISGVNIGTGYHREHTTACYADLSDTLSNVQKFIAYYRKYLDTYLAAPPVKRFYDTRSNNGYDRLFGLLGDTLPSKSQAGGGYNFERCSQCDEWNNNWTYTLGQYVCEACMYDLGLLPGDDLDSDDYRLL